VTFVCAQCGADFQARRSARAFRTTFCSREHYFAYRTAHATYDQAEGVERLHREYEQFKRRLWGGSGYGAKEVGPWARRYGRRYEEIARDVILPAHGFTEIDDWSGQSNVFFVDFVATREGQRVLVDVSCKWSAYVPEKVRFAASLRMPLYLLMVAPADPTRRYWLHLTKPGRTVFKVPMALFRAWAEETSEGRASIWGTVTNKRRRTSGS
jgi:hypothetical protein